MRSDKYRAQRKIHYAAHREEIKAYLRSYYAAHREEQIARCTAYRLAHLDAIKAQRRTHYLATKDEHRFRNIKQKYGLTREGFNSLLRQQDNRCAICGSEEFTRKGPVIDHDHIFGHVRGILCANCNCLIGYAKDDISILKMAVEYLNKSKLRTISQQEVRGGN